MTRKSAALQQPPATAEDNPRPLTAEDRVTAFRIATSSFVIWYAGQIEAGMTNPELEAALELSLGIMGGSCGPGMMDVSYQGPGLRIWATWESATTPDQADLCRLRDCCNGAGGL